MASVSRDHILVNMESDPEELSPSLTRYVRRQSRLWTSGSSEAMNEQPPGTRPSVIRRGSKSIRSQFLNPDSGEAKQPTESPERRRTVHHGVRKMTIGPHPPPPDVETLLELCNTCRRSLKEDKCLGPRRGELIKMLGTAVQSEYEGVPILSLQTIDAARLDKLLSDILDAENHPHPTPVQFRADVQIAESLQRQWRTRFRELYFGLDHMRYTGLTGPGGRLENMVFKGLDEVSSSSKNSWEAKSGIAKLSEGEGNAKFGEGYWWLNIACAHRDGILCSPRGALSKGGYDIPALALLTGTEHATWPGAHVTYTRESDSMVDMCIPLLTLVGKKVRILRGHHLISPFAPHVGVRYDGQYRLRQYGQQHYEQRGKWRLNLRLERVAGQTPMHDLAIIPKPSQVDQWHLFEKYEGDVIRARYGARKFLEWKTSKAEETIDREEAERTEEFLGMNFVSNCVEKKKEDGSDLEDMDKVRRISDLRFIH